MSDRYWHFAQVDNEGVARLGYGDNREIRVGETLRVEGEPQLCEAGLHASAKLWDALGYAQGNKLALCRVTLGGTVLHDNNKSVANERTVIAMLDADATERILREWARWCALQSIHLWDAAMAATRDAAMAATRDAAMAATRDAAMAATRDAAMDAAMAAAWAAARAATRDAAWDAAWDAAIESYTDELERRCLSAMDVAE